MTNTKEEETGGNEKNDSRREKKKKRKGILAVFARKKQSTATRSEYDSSKEGKGAVSRMGGPTRRNNLTSREVLCPPAAGPGKVTVKPFIEATMRKGVKGLQDEFRKMKRSNDFTKMVEFVKQNGEGRNRYKDVGCLDHGRVELTIGTQPYIHANYVATPNNPRRFICTQAPLAKTCGDFWVMVVQEKSPSVLMLCNFVEMGAKKCAEYFPNKSGSMDFDDGFVNVTFKHQKDFKFDFETKVRIIVTTLEVCVKDQDPHICHHYHWQDWPDRGVPEADLAPIALLEKITIDKAPIVVHCSAGIGRTGSIVLTQHVMELYRNGDIVNEISLYVLELRKQRNNSVQTEHQYLYVHQVFLQFLKKHKLLDGQVLPYVEAFTKDYTKATAGF